MMKIRRSMIRCLFFSCLYCCTLGVQAEAEDIQPSCSWNIGTETLGVTLEISSHDVLWGDLLVCGIVFQNKTETERWIPYFNIRIERVHYRCPELSSEWCWNPDVPVVDPKNYTKGKALKSRMQVFPDSKRYLGIQEIPFPFPGMWELDFWRSVSHHLNEYGTPLKIEVVPIFISDLPEAEKLKFSFSIQLFPRSKKESGLLCSVTVPDISKAGYSPVSLLADELFLRTFPSGGPPAAKKWKDLEERFSPGVLRNCLTMKRLTAEFLAVEDERLTFDFYSCKPQYRFQATKELHAMVSWLKTLPEVERHGIGMQLVSADWKKLTDASQKSKKSLSLIRHRFFTLERTFAFWRTIGDPRDFEKRKTENEGPPIDR